ncbi:hypothetical protein B0J13DRAFT_556625 [Dactylonectria estremocensis]|uniref:Uncharacterized protein n=1 Tax=Dactylonectria estremocensis TaxID=1079267 RepID=A0A9P9EPQ6_9HYPO|nr:hypothetical protein B0J13DRAFT_556625 [Dactylonectria estremocensis]
MPRWLHCIVQLVHPATIFAARRLPRTPHQNHGRDQGYWCIVLRVDWPTETLSGAEKEHHQIRQGFVTPGSQM